MIQEKAIHYFNTHSHLKVLFLFDESQEFLDEVQQIATSAFKVVFWENNPFVLKYQLTHEWQEQKVLLYLPMTAPNSQEMYHQFPLMGLLLANKELQLDNVGAFMEQFGLQRHQKSLVNKYMAELKYEGVQKVVTPILTSGNFQEKELQQGLIAAILKFKKVENWSILIAKLCILAQENNEATFKRVFQKIDKLQLQEVILNNIHKQLGVKLASIKASELLNAMKSVLYNYTMQHCSLSQKDVYASLKIADTSQMTSINQFWQTVENSQVVAKDFQELMMGLEEDIRGAQLVAAYGVEAAYHYYSVDLVWAILEQLQDQIITNNANALKVLENLALQQEIQGEQRTTIAFFRQVLKTTIAIKEANTERFASPDTYITNYTEEGYKIDLSYRRAIVAFNEIDSAEVPDSIRLEEVKDQINTNYNAYTDQLNRNWLKCLSSIDFQYNSIQTPKQYDFYKTEVAQVDQKLVVIISDAMRYEVGVELLSKMHADPNNTAEMRYLLASIPSKTNIGMAQLLPGEKTFNDGDILSDTITTASTNRAKILQDYQPNAEAVQFESVKNAKQSENRALFKKDLVYVYHDVIDAIGDKRVSERRTFEAVKNAIAELTRFVKLLHGSYNVTNVLITADHGFLYNDEKLEDKELEKIPGDPFISHNRFFITKTKEKNELGYTIPLQNTTAFKEEAFVHIPFSTNRYKKGGVGHQFVHGGASLQELVTPLIISSRKRVEVSRKVNPSLLNKGKLRVVSNILKFNILQENEVSRLEKERTITIALYKDSSKVSNEIKLVLNSTSEAPSDRLTNIELILDAAAVNESVLKLKVYDIEDSLNPLIDELVTNNTLLGQDF